MAKMRLDVDALQVESFSTGSGALERGTVRAHSEPTPETDVVLLPVTDWNTCKGDDCTRRTLCHDSCLGACAQPADTVAVERIG